MNDKQLSEVIFMLIFWVRPGSSAISMYKCNILWTLTHCMISSFQLGVHNLYLRQKILAAFEEGESNGYHKLASPASGDTAPSAPVATDTPSAPPMAPLETYQSNECVVCLENKVKHALVHQANETCISCFAVQHHFSPLWARLLVLEM